MWYDKVLLLNPNHGSALLNKGEALQQFKLQLQLNEQFKKNSEAVQFLISQLTLAIINLPFQDIKDALYNMIHFELYTLLKQNQLNDFLIIGYKALLYYTLQLNEICWLCCKLDEGSLNSDPYEEESFFLTVKQFNLTLANQQFIQKFFCEVNLKVGSEQRQ